MTTTLLFSFPEKYFEKPIPVISFINPPYIPKNDQDLNINFRSFFDDETADYISDKISELEMTPAITGEVWEKDEVNIMYTYYPKYITKK